MLYLALEGKTKGLGEVTGIAGERAGKSEKGRRGGEREREGQGKGWKHVFQAPHRERGQGKRRRMKRQRKKGRDR